MINRDAVRKMLTLDVAKHWLDTGKITLSDYIPYVTDDDAEPILDKLEDGCIKKIKVIDPKEVTDNKKKK